MRKPLVTSVSVRFTPSHDLVRVYNRGALSGELVVAKGDGLSYARRLLPDACGVTEEGDGLDTLVRTQTDGVLKTCGCGRKHEAHAWEELPLVGYHRHEWGEVQELRNCGCGSTLVLVLCEGEPEEGANS